MEQLLQEFSVAGARRGRFWTKEGGGLGGVLLTC